MNNTDYKIHPYCFLSALPDTKVMMSLIDCTQQAKLAEVHNDDGFIYSEYKHDGSSEPLKVGLDFLRLFHQPVLTPSLQRYWLKMRQVVPMAQLWVEQFYRLQTLSLQYISNVVTEPAVVILVSLMGLELA